MDKYDFILARLKVMDEETIIKLWNDYCEHNNDPDGTIHLMCEVDELVSTEGKTALEIWNEFARDFDDSDDYVQFGIYGIQSSSNPVEDFVSLEDLARDIERYDPDEFWDEIDADELAEAMLEFIETDNDLSDIDREDLRSWLLENPRIDWEDALDEYRDEREDL